MPVNTLPVDSASRPADGLFDPTTGHVIAAKSGTVATSGGGVEYAPAIINIADPTTPANQLAVNNLGQIAISNFPSVQSVIGTVSIAQFPSVQTVSGSVDVSDRTARQLGHVIVDLGGAGTNTAPGYSVIQDGTLNTRKMVVNADGSINISGTISATNPSVSATGAAVPASATYLGANKSGNIAGLTLDTSNNLNVNIQAGTVTATNPSVGTDGSAIPTSSTLVGASDGTNLQPVQVDGSKNLKVNIAAGSVTATQATGSNLHTVVDSGTITATTNADTTIGGTSAPSKGLLAIGKTNDGTPQYQPVPEGAGGRSIIVEGFVGGTAVPVSGSGNFTVAQATGSNLHAVLDTGSTTAATQATASNLNAQVVGSVASAGSNAGNPVKVGGVFNTTQPTVTTGQIVDAQMTARGAQIVAVGTDGFAVTANAGTNLNTSLLALETGGNLATLAGAVTSAKVQANVSQINGVAPTMGNGVSGTGVQRVTIASDSTGQVTLAAGTTTAVTQATASSLNAQVVGSVASGASNAGNPVKVGGAFNTTQPTVTNGQAVDAQMTARGAQIVATGTDTFNVTVNAALPAGGNVIGALSANQSVNVAQWSGAANSTTNPVIVEPNVQNWTRNAQTFAAALNRAAGGVGNFGLSIFNAAANTKNVLIYAIEVWNGGGTTIFQAQQTTTDPALGNLLVPLNAKFGGAASSLLTTNGTVTFNTTTTSIPGTLYSSINCQNSQTTQMIQNGAVILLPAGSANALSVWSNGTNGTYGITVRWVEY